MLVYCILYYIKLWMTLFLQDEYMSKLAETLKRLEKIEKEVSSPMKGELQNKTSHDVRSLFVNLLYI